MIREYTTDGKEVTEEQLREVQRAKESPIVFDEDCPPLSEAMKKAFQCAVVQRNRNRRA